MSPQRRVAELIANIKAQMEHPGSLPMTSSQLKQQADRRLSIAQSIQLTGGTVAPEYKR